MLETYNAQQSVLYEGQRSSFDPSYFLSILKRRILFFLIPFVVLLAVSAAVIHAQQKIYRAEGKLLVESPQIAPELVRPTINGLPNERFAVFKQRILAGDNLLSVINKFNLFPGERASLSQSQLLDLMRARAQIKPSALEIQSVNPTLAFSVSFDYDVQDVALKVTNEFITEILSEDASRRTNTATETTQFLELEVKNLQGQHDTTVAQIEALKQRPPDQEHPEPEVVEAQMKSLNNLEADLSQKSSIYSDEHPVIKNLKKQIATLKHDLALTPHTAATSDKTETPDLALRVLQRKEADLAKSLEDANRKLSAARLGENMERNQQAEHLRVIEYPELPDKPIKPDKLKLFAIAAGAAGAISAGAAAAAEILDDSIRRTEDLAKVFDRHLIVTIPYLSTPNEDRRKRRNIILLCTALLLLVFAIFAAVMAIDFSVDFAGLESWMHILTTPSH